MSVQELIAALSKLPPETKVFTRGADSGGYDVIFFDGAILSVVDAGVVISGNNVDNKRFMECFLDVYDGTVPPAGSQDRCR